MFQSLKQGTRLRLKDLLGMRVSATQSMHNLMRMLHVSARSMVSTVVAAEVNVSVTHCVAQSPSALAGSGSICWLETVDCTCTYLGGPAEPA